MTITVISAVIKHDRDITVTGVDEVHQYLASFWA